MKTDMKQAVTGLYNSLNITTLPMRLHNRLFLACYSKNKGALISTLYQFPLVFFQKIRTDLLNHNQSDTDYENQTGASR